MGNARSVSDNLIVKMAAEVCKEIDAQVMFNSLAEAGWHAVKLSRFESMHHAVDIAFWLEENCQQGYHQKAGAQYLFKSEQDATLFALKWL